MTDPTDYLRSLLLQRIKDSNLGTYQLTGLQRCFRKTGRSEDLDAVLRGYGG
jgi:hypothetical protein